MKETKYLGMAMDEHLTFKNHMDTVKLKLNTANGLLAKLRHYVNSILLRTIYYAIFESHLQYGCQLCGKTQTQVLQNIEKITHGNQVNKSIYNEFKIFELKDIITIKAT